MRSQPAPGAANRGNSSEVRSSSSEPARAPPRAIALTRETAPSTSPGVARDTSEEAGVVLDQSGGVLVDHDLGVGKDELDLALDLVGDVMGAV